MNESDQHEQRPKEPEPPETPEVPAEDHASRVTVPAPSDSTLSDAPVVVALSREIREPIAAPPDASAGKDQLSDLKVHIAPNLIEVATGTTAVGHAALAGSSHDLDVAVHRLLVVGLGISTALMLIGLALDLLLQRELPTVVPNLDEVWNRVLVVRPSGFLALGLLVLIATPIIRVIGSIIIFAYERDWRFALITLIVLAIVTLSLLLGRA